MIALPKNNDGIQLLLELYVFLVGVRWNQDETKQQQNKWEIQMVFCPLICFVFSVLFKKQQASPLNTRGQGQR